jgi:hypothetical protein
VAENNLGSQPRTRVNPRSVGAVQVKRTYQISVTSEPNYKGRGIRLMRCYVAKKTENGTDKLDQTIYDGTPVGRTLRPTH